MNPILSWSLRILAIVFALFLALFALDTPIFSLGFLIHLIPSAIILLTVTLTL